MNAHETTRRALDVYLVPLGAKDASYELYCESPEREEPRDEATRGGMFHTLYRRFRQVVETAQDERRARRLVARSAHPAGLAGWSVRLRDRAIAYVAESIAEQRLLWRLRGESSVLLRHPDDLGGAPALAIARRQIARDADRHLRWMVIDGLILIVTGVVAIIPGPNLLAYYFTFRSVGHFLSWRGARNGLSGVDWSTEPSAPLTLLRDMPTLELGVRAERIRDVESRLQLERLAAFVERTAGAVKSA